MKKVIINGAVVRTGDGELSVQWHDTPSKWEGANVVYRYTVARDDAAEARAVVHCICESMRKVAKSVRTEATIRDPAPARPAPQGALLEPADA